MNKPNKPGKKNCKRREGKKNNKSALKILAGHTVIPETKSLILGVFHLSLAEKSWSLFEIKIQMLCVYCIYIYISMV